MGGGTSKPQEGSTARQPVAPASAPSTNGPSPATVARGLACTVQEANKNTVVAFQSSVKGFSVVEGNDSPASDASVITESEDQVFILGDVAVSTVPLDVHPVKSPAAALTSPRSISSTSSYSCIVKTPLIPLHFASTTVQFPASKEKTSSVGDLVLRRDFYLPPGESSFQFVATDKLFARRVPFAVPSNYVFSPCGGQSGPIRCISSSSDGTQFAVAVAGNKFCFLVDSTSGRNVMSFRGHLDPVLSCAHSRDSKFLVTASADCTVVMWDLNNGKKLREIPVSYQANVCAVTDESDVVATTSTEDFVHTWDAKSCDPLVNFQRHSASIFSLSFSRRSQLVASGSTNGEIFVWNHVTGDVKFLFAKHRTPVLAVSFAHDGQRLVSVDRESIRMWDLFTGHCVFCRDTRGKVTCGAEDIEERDPISHDDTVRFTSCCFVAGNLVLCASTTKTIMLLEPNTGTEVLSIPTRGVVTSFATNWVADVVFVGDFLGNHHRLQLTFSPRDVKAFNLNAKYVTKDKGSRLEKD